MKEKGRANDEEQHNDGTKKRAKKTDLGDCSPKLIDRSEKGKKLMVKQII